MKKLLPKKPKALEENKPAAISLTAAQRLAVTKSETNILVSAGAGTGKTRVLVERFLHFVTQHNTPVGEILALTYTEKASNEMKARILKRFSEMGRDQDRRDLESSYISTIHAFCSRILKEHPLEAGVDPDFRVIQEEEADYLQEQTMDEAFDALCVKGSEIFELIRLYGEKNIRNGLRSVLNAARHEGKYLAGFFGRERSVEELKSPAAIFEKLEEPTLAAEFLKFSNLKNWDWKTVSDFSEWQSTFSRRSKKGDDSWKIAKKQCADFRASKIEELARPWKQSFETLAAAFEKIYEDKKREAGFLDFDDLQIKTLALFKNENPIHLKLRKRYQEKFRAILVDEFQDTNWMQLELIETLKSGNNLFFVGDFKQSIYKFRGAEPSLFLKLETEYRDSKKGLRISMAENFRSQKGVLDFVNRFFEALWQEDGLPFEPLVPAGEEVESSEVELMVVPLEEGEETNHGRLREADAIAERILELQEQGTAFGHMAVLFQAVKDVGIYEQALKKRNIPYFTLSGRGFYYQHEIRDMISYLSVLENPLSDIPLAASLRSPLFQISDDALFWLSYDAKSQDKKEISTPLYEGVKRYADNPHLAETEKRKIRHFMEMTQEFLSVKDRLKLTELIDLILSKTAYELTALADPQGVRKFANLKKLMNLAREFESLEPLGLGDFLRMVNRLEIQEARESEAQIEAVKSGQVVQLLSIHRAKGLEFPVVFVGDLGREKAGSDSVRVLAEPLMGYSLQVWNPEQGEWEDPISWVRIKEASRAKEREEWKRLFYVAATRAEQRLIFSGVHKPKKKEKENFREMATWMDWMMALIPQFETVSVREIPKHFPLKRKYALAETHRFHETFPDFEPRPVEKLLPNQNERKDAETKAQTIFTRFEALEITPSRVIDLPVSAFAAFRQSQEKYRRVYEIGYQDDGAEYRFEAPMAAKEDIPAADFGTAMHWVLERLDFQNPSYGLESLLKQAMQCFGGKAMTRAQKMLKDFFKSPLFLSLSKAKTLKRELPFLLNERHGVIHGVIDVLYQDLQGEWHVVDYKTGDGSAAKIQEAGYDKQMEIYVYAVQALLGQAPKTAVLYFMNNSWENRQTIDSRWLANAQSALKSDQEKMLEMRNQMLLASWR